MKKRNWISAALASGHRFAIDRSGAPAVEFALVLPFAVIMLTGLLEYGMMIYQADSLEAGARAGAQYAISKGLDTAGIQSTVQAAGHIDPGTFVVSSAQFCECAGVANSCNTTCSPSTTPLQKFINVTVVQNYTPVLGLLDFATPSSLKGAVTVRVP